MCLLRSTLYSITTFKERLDMGVTYKKGRFISSYKLGQLDISFISINLIRRMVFSRLLNLAFELYSCINQLFPRALDLLYSWISRCFLDMCKVFDSPAWGSYFQQWMGILNQLFDLKASWKRFQRIPFTGQTSEWFLVKAGASQGSPLGPLFCNLH